ncbi:homoserine dehydrogenase [Clostridium intestinale]|jgi:homoserine dehydrogenase|uniref:Homoserine dehydrogenase n=1 Tax=Clostridium intestinale URNW TaxID=1294142 RepID=U2NUD5_9CLOT|nr:homoserine dehydrogenase [Clostridium intestinale]ERK32481.1 homoserine dehydrogenase [Clostridium intestinale URNW]
MKKIKIALLGLGNVGRGVWNIINENGEEIRKRSGYDVEISKILVRDKDKARGVEVPEEILTTNYSDIVEDKEIKIVVELMGGVNPAKEYMLEAMSKKKHVVTANKMVLATEGEELFEAADREGVMFYYEASVAGGIPIIQGVNESLAANKIEQLYGIVNGTTNYILSKMELEDMDFDDALKEAQEKGYAEADPTSDIEAYDATYKLAIISSLAFGTKIRYEDIYREGITKINSMDIKYAKELGFVIKLLAIAKDVNGELELRVHPTLIPKTHPLANVYDSFNAIFIKGNAVGDLMLYGRGAGDLPTGSAVVGDILSVLRNESNLENYSAIKNNLWERNLKPMSDVNRRYYLRITVKDKPGVLGDITTIFGKNNVSMRSIIQREREADNASLVIITHHTKEGDLMNSVDKIKELDSLESVDNILRIESFNSK